MNPGKRSSSGADGWYRYYAGYSGDFVRDMLATMELEPGSVVFDPWNGAGTTTAVASEQGLRAIGFDLNPAMAIVAKARLLGAAVSPSELALADSILEVARRNRGDPLADDLLLTWFQPSTAAGLRDIERAVYHCLVDTRAYEPLGIGHAVTKLSKLAAFFYLALFRTTRALVSPFQSSNPTWVRRKIPTNERRRVSREQVARAFRAHVARMLPEAGSPAQTLVKESHSALAGEQGEELVTIAVASSEALPQSTSSTDAVISSPPYCTRIDYAVATAPELAVLGFNTSAFRELREKCIGTSAISGDICQMESSWGSTCVRFLKRVATHSSKASAGYYLKTHLQYFGGLFRSLTEIDRVLKPSSPCVLVVQDSHYKEVHNDLPRIVIEMGDYLGWKLATEHRFPASRLMARVHPTSRKYRSSPTATEVVLELETARQSTV